MKAIRYYQYGPPGVLKLEDAGVPAVGDQDVLVRVTAASVNPLDWHFMRGTPYLVRLAGGLRRPANSSLGVDLAGRVEAVGRHVTVFSPGDEVFGAVPGRGSLAEYVVLPQDGALLPRPARLSAEQAAAAPVAGLTALQALRDKGHLQPGQKVLVNGASGGVGTFTVQIAAALGAGEVIDYTRQDFTRTGRRCDLLVDIAGSRSFSACRRVLAPRGTLVGAGGPDNGRWLGPATRPARAFALSPFVSQTLTFFIARMRREDLAVLAALLDEGKVTPVIDRAYPLSAAAEAVRYLEEGHARGKVVITV